MAMISTNTIFLNTLLAQITAMTGDIKAACVNLLAQGSVTRRAALDMANRLADRLASLDALTANAGTNGLVAYAQAQCGNPTRDLAGEYTACRTQIAAVQSWLVANFPKDASGNLVVYAFNGNNRFVDIALTAGELSAFKTQLTNLSATID